MRLTVIGGGHVGRVLGRLLAARAGFVLADVLARSAASAQNDGDHDSDRT